MSLIAHAQEYQRAFQGDDALPTVVDRGDRMTIAAGDLREYVMALLADRAAMAARIEALEAERTILTAEIAFAQQKAERTERTCEALTRDAARLDFMQSLLTDSSGGQRGISVMWEELEFEDGAFRDGVALYAGPRDDFESFVGGADDLRETLDDAMEVADFPAARSAPSAPAEEATSNG